MFKIIFLFLYFRTKAAVRDLDNLNYRKMKKILMVDSCDTESALGDEESVIADGLGDGEDTTGKKFKFFMQSSNILIEFSFFIY